MLVFSKNFDRFCKIFLFQLKSRVDRLEKKASAQNFTTAEEFIEIPFATT